ncbi:unnamed protein product [Caenorhabditis bovis]|uniref:SET domain-containing protein n=1 Tax=Caenorhabditis bovis TaxID=2654633 RepID=A0A8S1E3L2_9PELO|nr:unnamed protein product [Caenorhabditis bovis]
MTLLEEYSESAEVRSYEEKDKILENVKRRWDTLYDEEFMYLMTSHDFREGVLSSVTDVNIANCSRSTLSFFVRRLLRHFGDTDGAREILIFANKVCQKPCARVSMVMQRRATNMLPDAPTREVTALRFLKCGEFITSSLSVKVVLPDEINRNGGAISKNCILFTGLSMDFQFFVNIDDNKNAKKQKENELNDSKPSEKSTYAKQLIENIKKYTMCLQLDNSTESDLKLVKSIRRSCKPNSVLRYVILNQRIEFFICATQDIQENEEITLPHDFDYYLSPKILQCACNGNCSFEVFIEHFSVHTYALIDNYNHNLKILEMKTKP